MSEDQEVGKLVEKVDELLLILNRVVEDLEQVSGSLKTFTASKTSQPQAAPPPEKTEASQPQETMGEIKEMFPDDLKSLLS
ncbi:MAG: hypothetical protein ACOC6G_03020, partial [Thermoproteota archaeon]